MLVDGEPEYEVESIINDRSHRNQHQYLIRWKGYSAAHDSWIPEKELSNAPDLLAEYLAQKTPTRKST